MSAKGQKRPDGRAYNAKTPTPSKPKVKPLPEGWRVQLRLTAQKAVSIAAYIAEHSPRRDGVPKGCIKIDELDTFRNQNLIARIATMDDDAKAQQELEEALQRRAAG